MHNKGTGDEHTNAMNREGKRECEEQHMRISLQGKMQRKT